MEYKKDRLVLCKPYALQPYFGWHFARLTGDTKQWFEGDNICYGVEILSVLYGWCGKDGNPWWCYEPNIILLPENISDNKIKALKVLLHPNDI